MELFTKRIAKDKYRKEFRIENIIKRKGDKFYVKWKEYDNSFNSQINKKTLYTNESILSYFPKPLRSVRRNFNLKVYLSNYATKTDLKNVTHVDTSSLALKTNLANLKT